MKKVLIDGVFNLFHYGHMKLFKKIKESNDYIIVAGIISDKDVESYKRVPILTMEERALMVESCKYVDEVIINCPLMITKEFVKENNIDLVYHAHSEDEHEKYLNLSYKIVDDMDIFRRVDYTPGISITDIINRCKNK